MVSGGDAMSKVYPSGDALDTSVAPILPPAPGLFSITMGCPSSCDNLPLMSLAMLSIRPPGGKGTTSLMGRVGHDCADAERVVKSTQMNTVRCLIMISFKSIKLR